MTEIADPAIGTPITIWVGVIKLLAQLLSSFA
jgi:hypothetical protein